MLFFIGLGVVKDGIGDYIKIGDIIPVDFVATRLSSEQLITQIKTNSMSITQHLHRLTKYSGDYFQKREKTISLAFQWIFK
jgi:hypothetical protein